MTGDSHATRFRDDGSLTALSIYLSIYSHLPPAFSSGHPMRTTLFPFPVHLIHRRPKELSHPPHTS